MGRWTKPEDNRLKEAVKVCGEDFRRIAAEYFLGHRKDTECMNRWTQVSCEHLFMH